MIKAAEPRLTATRKGIRVACDVVGGGGGWWVGGGRAVDGSGVESMGVGGICDFFEWSWVIVVKCWVNLLNLAGEIEMIL